MKTDALSAASPGQAHTHSSLEMHVVLAYENLSAALHATEVLTSVSRKDPDGLTMHLLPWSFARLESPEGRALAATDVERANLLVIAESDATPRLSAAIEHWLKTCLTRRREIRLAVAAISRPYDRPNGGDSPWLHGVRRIAQEAGCAFFASPAVGELAGIV
jgi:hypothetical protein